MIGTILFSLMSPSPITIVIVHPEVYLVTSFFSERFMVLRRCCLWLCNKNIFWKTLDVFLILTITILIIKFYKESITHQSKFWWSWSFLIFLFCPVLAVNHIFNLWMESRSWTLERSFKGSGRWEQTWSFY